MKKINEIFSYKESDPEKFWNDLTSLLLEEYKSTTFAEELKSVMSGAYVCFLSKKSNGEKLPYHLGYYVQSNELQFRYFVQVTAQSENEIEYPMPIITGILPFPGEQCYTFHIHDNGQGEDVVDVFAPHMIDHYARRAYRLPNDLSMPNTWHKDKRQPDEFDFNDKEVKKLFMLFGKFFARNKINVLCKNDKALSINEQGIDSDDYECLWMDGLTYCKPFCNKKVWLHKTFVPYFRDASVKDDSYLSEDQLKAIAADLNNLFKKASQYFPIQYKTSGLDWTKIIIIHHWIGQSLNSVINVQERVWPFFERWGKMGLISITGNEPPKFTYKEIQTAKATLEDIDNCDIKESNLAQSVLVVWANLWWHLRDFENWYEENGRLNVLNEHESLQTIRLMRGMNLRDVILFEADLLSKSYESEVMKNLLPNQ